MMKMHQVSTKVEVSNSRRIKFEFEHLIAYDWLSAPFSYELEVTGSAGMDIDRMLGMQVAVRVSLQGPIGRYFHGQVEQVEALPGSGKKAKYRLRLGPDLARLARCSQNRVFAEKTLADVIAEVLAAHAIHFDTAYTRTQIPQQAIVQFGESDLDFVSRLMDEAGIFYYFNHAADRHELMLCDSSDGIVEMTGYEAQRILSASETGEGVVFLDPVVRAGVSRFELDDVDPGSPDLDLSAGYGILRRGAPCATLRRYPGGYTDVSQGIERARTRLHAVQAKSQIATGMAASRGILVGRSFKLSGHARREQNTDQVPIETITTIEAGPVTAARAKLKTAKMHCEIVTVLLGAPMPLPTLVVTRDLRGPHTARVVATTGETVDVDVLAQVRVRFPWQDDAEPGIWARVGQSWAGSGRGALVLPHAGDEVLVEFEHGDARRPVVVASLYNGTALPPVQLPDGKMRTLFRTRESGRGVASELSFDDRPGAELLSFRAGRDMETLVSNDLRVQVGGSENRSVSGNATISVSGDLAVDADGDLLSTTSGDVSAVNERNLSLSVGKDLGVTIEGTGEFSAIEKLTISSDSQILIKNEKASIELKANGDVVIRGKNVLVEAAGQLRLKGSDVIEQEG